MLHGARGEVKTKKFNTMFQEILTRVQIFFVTPQLGSQAEPQVTYSSFSPQLRDDWNGSMKKDCSR